MFFKRIRVNEAFNALAGAEIEVMIAFWADLKILREGEIVNDFAAGWAFGPEAGRHLACFVAEGPEDRFFKNRHSLDWFLTSRQREGSDGFGAHFQEYCGTGVEGRSCREDIVNEQEVLISHFSILAC